MASPVSTPLDAGFVRRVAAGLRYAVTGAAPGGWFGPSQPMAAVAPAEVKGRAFDFPTGANLNYQPRAAEPVTFEQLRGLADGWDLLRAVIETKKDQIERLPWRIVARDSDPVQPGRQKPLADDGRIAEVVAFFRRPDRLHSWQQWLRMLIEDQLVIDAPALYLRKTAAGQTYALEVIDGATIHPILDASGRAPLDGPAYQQVLKGMPAVDYTAAELIYWPRNPRSQKVYGFSPVEQIVTTINIAIRRQIHQLQYYTDGSAPDLILSVPAEWGVDQIRQFSDYWDSMLTGNTAQRRGTKFVPSGVGVINTKDQALKDQFDDWLARLVCFAFSVTPSALVSQTNRSTAESTASEAQKEGLEPLKVWVKDLIDECLSRGFGYDDLEFVWQSEADIAPLQQAQIAQIYLAAGVLSIAEVRAGLGLAGAAGQGPGPVAKFNANHVPGGCPEGGQFCSGDAASAGVLLVQARPPSGGRTSQRGLIQRDLSPLEELRLQEYESYRQQLIQLNPNHRRLSGSISRPDWVPTKEDVEGMRRDAEGERDAQRERMLQAGLPKKPDELLNRGYVETTHPNAAANGHRTFADPRIDDIIRFDEAEPGKPGFKGVDHYHRLNPEKTGGSDAMLDKDGNPVPYGSRKSHLFSGE